MLRLLKCFLSSSESRYFDHMHSFKVDAVIKDTIIPGSLMDKVRFETITLYRFYSIVNYVRLLQLRLRAIVYSTNNLFSSTL